MRLELSGLHSDPVTLHLAPGTPPARCLPFPLLPLPALSPLGNEQAFLPRGFCCGGEKREGDYLKQSRRGAAKSRESSLQPRNRLSAAREERWSAWFLKRQPGLHQWACKALEILSLLFFSLFFFFAWTQHTAHGSGTRCYK